MALRGQKYGCQVGYEDPVAENIVADIVFVHGLTGKWNDTWTHCVKDSGIRICWPSDLLPADLRGGFRVIYFGYDADIMHIWNTAGQNDLPKHADAFVMHLTSLRMRTNTLERPIIFVGHSLGGLLIEKALLSSHSKTGNSTKIEQSTYGIIFMGTPHCGANMLAWARAATVLLKFKRSSDKILKQLEGKSDALRDTQEYFCRLLRKRNGREGLESGQKPLEIVNFYEEIPIRAIGKVVEDDSATMPGYENCSIHADHMGMARFQNTTDDGYAAVSGKILEWLCKLGKKSTVKKGQETQDGEDRPPSYDPLAESQRLEDLEWFDETANHHQTLRFIGREAYIKVIHDAIESLTESPKTVVLQGLGGQGKTSLAIQYAHIYHKSRYKLIFWVDASSPSTAQYHYGRIVDARELMKGVSMPTERQKVDRFLRYLKSPEAECLIIFDNFDATDPEEHNAIATILPTGGERLSIIITSRNYGTSTYGHALHVDGMSDDEAMALLLDRSKFQASDLSAEQKEACLNILNDVGNLPLAVEQAAAYMHNRRMDPRVFLVESRENRENVIKYIPQGSAYKKLVGLQPGPEAEGIYINAFATWELSLVAVGGGERGAAETSMSPAARLMSLVAFLDRTLLPSFMFKNATMSVNPSSTRRWLTDSCQKNSQWDQTKFRGLVIDLANLSLIDFRDTPDHSEFEFSIHPLVQEWARIRLTESERLWFFQQAIWFVADFLQPDNYDPEHIKTKALILKHLDAILVYDNLLFKPSSQVYLGRKDLIPITMRFASFYLDHGIYSQTRNLYQKIIDRNAQPKNRKEKLFVFEAIEGVAIVEMLEGNFKRAQEYCEKALEGYTTLLGTRSQYRLRALHNLGEIHGAQGNFTDVFELFKEALTGCEETLGLDHLLTLREVEGLGNAHRVSKRYDEAANYYVRALEGMKKQLPENHPDLLGVIEGLGIVRKGQRRFEEAAELYSTALRGDEDYLGENHPDTLNVVEGLGDVYAATKDATRALSLYERVKNARSMVVGVEHPDTIRVIDKINELSCPTGNIDFQHDTAYYPWYRTISSDEEDMALEHNGLWSWISRFWRINA